MPARRYPGLGRERPGELPRRQARPGRQPVHRQVRGRVLADPLLHLAQRLAARRLGPELGAELRLAARTAQVHDQVPGHRQRRRPADVLLDQRQRQVDARRHAGRGDHVAVPHVDRLRVDPHVWVAPGQLLAVGPVRGGPAPGQQARLGQQERAGADRGDAPGRPACRAASRASRTRDAPLLPPGTTTVSTPASEPAGRRRAPGSARWRW